MRVAILRPREYINETMSKLKNEGFDVIGIPFIKIIYLNNFDLNEIDFDVIIVTSQTAAKIVTDKNTDLLKGKKIIAIGKKTAEIFNLKGLKTEIPSKFDSYTMYNEFKNKLANKKVLVLRSSKGSDVLLKLKEVCELIEIKAYDIVFEHSYEQTKFVKEVFTSEYKYAIVFSSSMIAKSFMLLSEKLGFEPKNLKQCCIAIGPPTKSVLKKKGIKALVPPEYTFDGVIELLKKIRDK